RGSVHAPGCPTAVLERLHKPPGAHPDVEGRPGTVPQEPEHEGLPYAQPVTEGRLLIVQSVVLVRLRVPVADRVGCLHIVGGGNANIVTAAWSRNHCISSRRGVTGEICRGTRSR